MSGQPLVDAGITAGATAIYIMADEVAGAVPDVSGNGRASMTLSGSTEMRPSSSFPTMERVAWFTGSSSSHGEVPWAAWMDMGTSFTWIVVKKGGYSQQESQNRLANILSNGGDWFNIRHHSDGDRTLKVNVVSHQDNDSEAFIPDAAWGETSWHTLALRSVASRAEGWIDGLLEADAGVPTPEGTVGIATTRLCLGARYDDGTDWDRGWRGSVAAVLGFPSALSVANMEAIHAATTAEETFDTLTPWRVFREAVGRKAELQMP